MIDIIFYGYLATLTLLVVANAVLGAVYILRGGDPRMRIINN